MAYINKLKFLPNLPVISIISVTYNAEVYLEQTIISIIKQTYQNIELIIVDGGSTDGTLDIIKKYEDRISYWVSEPDNGIYDAMNKASKVITGDWVNFIGAGDILLNVLHKVAPMLEKSNYIYYGDVYRNDILKVFNGKFSAFRFSRVAICHQAILYPSSVFKKYQYDLKYKSTSDHHINLILYGDKSFKWKYIPVILCVYEGGGYSAVNKDFPFIKDRISIVKKNLPFIVYLYAASRNFVFKLLNPDYFK